MVEATCPKCDTVNHVGDELIGRYTLCDNCRCRFYVEVPTLEQNYKPTALHTSIRESPTPDTTLDELLWDTQQGARHLIEALDRQRRTLQRTNCALWTIGALTLANLICAILQLAR